MTNLVQAPQMADAKNHDTHVELAQIGLNSNCIIIININYIININ